MKNVFIVCALTILAGSLVAKEMYRAPSSGDSGSYFVLNSDEIEGGIIKVLTSRIGKGNAYTDFTELKINCESKQYYELAGGSADGAKDLPTKPLKDWSAQSNWTSLVVGSSKYDLVIYICNEYK